ncbi:MAG: O-antigen ligase family protein [Planctomycetes bacterium]|nr:O-antigen ligase family protein [Planctomycetota bacterium]
MTRGGGEGAVDAPRDWSGALFSFVGFVGTVVVLSSAALLATPYPFLALVPPLLLLSVLLFAFYPQFGFYLIIATIPFWAFRGLPGPLEFLKVHWLLALVLVMLLPLKHVPRKTFSSGLRSNLWPFFLLFVGVSLLSAIRSPYPESAFANVFRLGLAGVLVALTLVLVGREGFRRTLPTVLVWSVSASALLAVVGYFFDVPIFVSESEEDVFTRGSGGALGPVNLSFLIVSIVPFLGYRILFPEKRGDRIVSTALLIVNLLGLVTTFSRGGAILLALVALALLVEFARRIRIRHVLAFAASISVVALVVVPWIPDTWWARQKNVLEAQDKAMRRRFSYLVVAREAIEESPVLGHGPGTFRDIYAGTAWAREFEREGTTLRRFAHNTYLEVLVGTGAIGLATFLLVLYIGLRNYALAKKEFLRKGEKALALLTGSYRLSFLAILAFFFLKSAVDNKTFLVALALSSVAARVAREAAPRSG